MYLENYEKLQGFSFFYVSIIYYWDYYLKF